MEILAMLAFFAFIGLLGGIILFILYALGGIVLMLGLLPFVLIVAIPCVVIRGMGIVFNPLFWICIILICIGFLIV